MFKCCVSAIFEGPGVGNLKCYVLYCQRAGTSQLEILGNSLQGKSHHNESCCDGINPT